MSALISTGLIASSARTSDHSAPAAAIAQVLEAHNAWEADALSSFNAEAVRLTFYNDSRVSKLPDFFERKISVSSNGNAFRRIKSDPMGLTIQLDLFDGQTAYQAAIEKGSTVTDAHQVSDSQFEGVRFSIRTFGLVPILKQLSDPATEVVYLGASARRQDKFEVKTAAGRYILYTDHQHLIRKVEIGDKTILFADYRSVEGIQLPFIEKFFIGENTVYEIFFTHIDLNPEFPEDYFTREALSKDVTR